MMIEIILTVLAFPTIWLVATLLARWIEDAITKAGWKNNTASMAQFVGWARWTATPSIALAIFLYLQI